MAKITLSKLEAAKRQLQAAVRMYFLIDDPVSIHTLTAAAYNILRDVTEKQHADPMFIKGHMLEMVKPEHKKTISDKANEAENFFKHADRDHEATLDFDPDLTELYILDACAQYRKLTGKDNLLFVVYRAWIAVKNPDLFIFPEQAKTFLEAHGPSIAQMGRAEFFKEALTLLNKVAKKG